MSKHIVLLADGTWNSAESLHRSNVWRLYDALDRSDPSRQVAVYFDGVGSKSIVDRMPGGVFGYGIEANVLGLYRVLCRLYEPGDRISAFGFSRGAFTIQLLCGLVLDQGLMQSRRGARWEYRAARLAYRRFARRLAQPRVVSAYRAVQVALATVAQRLSPGTPPDVRHSPIDQIEFLGLWDTVGAYGVPLIGRIRPADTLLRRQVKRACHALAIDDERQTFYPVLWDESDEPGHAAAHLNDERISQVWFAGAHSNVGGGYGEDSLSYVSLAWMVEEARRCGLRFDTSRLQAPVANPMGRLHDSRVGLAASYRYLPRHIARLTTARTAGLIGRAWRKQTRFHIERPKIHESVFTRIFWAPEGYAPVGVPERYAVVRQDGRIVEEADNPFEHPTQSRWRARVQEAVWDLIWWKRIWYFTSVAIVAVLLLAPLTPGVDSSDADQSRMLGASIRAVGRNLPSVAAPWVDYHGRRSVDFAALLIVLGLGLALSSRLSRAIGERMDEIWATVLADGPGRPTARPLPPLTWLARLRWSPGYEGFFSLVRRAGSAVGMVWLVVAALAVANRGVFEVASFAGQICRDSVDTRLVEDDVMVDFDTRQLCHASGLVLRAGERYDIRVLVNEMQDARTGIPDQRGLRRTARWLSTETVAYALFTPSRRVWGTNWFVPVAQVGAAGGQRIPLHQATTSVTPSQTGELFLFVNDSILPVVRPSPPFSTWRVFYDNNSGHVAISITRVEDTTVRTGPILRMSASGIRQ